jgi:hypothetical protein
LGVATGGPSGPRIAVRRVRKVGDMDQSNSSLGVEELLAQYAGAGLDELKDWNEENLRRIAEHFERTDFDAIREDYDAGVYDDFL